MFLIRAKLAREYFVFVGVSLIFVPQRTEMMIVHLRFLEGLQQIIILQKVNDWILLGLNLEVILLSSQELQSHQERILIFHNFFWIHDKVVKIRPSFLRGKPYLSWTENVEIETILNSLEDLLWVAYVNLNSLCKRVKSLIHEILEECQFLEDSFVAFFQILFF